MTKNTMLKNTAMCIIDAQYDFFEGGSLDVPNSNKILDNILKLIESFKGGYIFVSQDWHPSNHSSFHNNNGLSEPDFAKEMWPPHCVVNDDGTPTKGAKIHSTIQEALGKAKEANPDLNIIYTTKGKKVEADSYSFLKDNDKEWLDSAEQIKTLGLDKFVVFGLATDFCVKFSALDIKLLLPDSDITFVKDASEGLSETSVLSAITEMKEADINVSDTVDLLANYTCFSVDAI